MDLEQRLRRAQAAEALWNDPLMVEARKHIEQAIVDKFKTAPLADKEGLYDVRLLLHVHALYDAFFKQAISDGPVARLEIENRRRGLLDRVRRVI